MIVAAVLFTLLAFATAYGFRRTRRGHNWSREVQRENAHRAKHPPRTAWIDYARDRHLQLWRSRSRPTYVLRATREEVPFVVDVFLDDAVPLVRVRARALSPQPRVLKAWRPDVAGEIREIAVGERPPVGDPAFDEAYRVNGGPEDAQALLDTRVRRALLAVPRVTCFEYDRGDVRLEWTGSDPGPADAAIEAVVAACRSPEAAAYR